MAWDTVAVALAVLASAVATRQDYRTRRIPNALTLPLWGLGLLLHWPGEPVVWLTSALLVIGWKYGMMGGGDAKLWLALLWLTPLHLMEIAVTVMWTAFIITGLGQLLWRRYHNKPVVGVATPAAWRTVPYAVWLALATLSLYAHFFDAGFAG